MESRSPAQLYALVLGVVLVAVGIIGFFYEASFATGGEPRAAVFGAFDVNGWHNVVHLLTGVLGLAVAGSWSGARTYALALGVVYVLIAIWGFASTGETLVSLLPINTADNILHLVIGIAGFGAYAATPAAPAPTAA
jgi:hypothetical protein